MNGLPWRVEDQRIQFTPFQIGGLQGGPAVVIGSGSIQSENWNGTDVGWLIEGNGDVWFNNGKFRGDLIAGTLSTAESGARVTIGTSYRTYIDLYSGDANEVSHGYINVGADTDEYGDFGFINLVAPDFSGSYRSYLDIRSYASGVRTFSVWGETQSFEGNVFVNKNLTITKSTFVTEDLVVSGNGFVSKMVETNTDRFTLTLATGWAMYDAGWNEASFTKSSNGIVFLEGLVTKYVGDSTVFPIIGWLPGWAAPVEGLVFTVGSSNGPVRVDVLPNGAIQFNPADNPGAGTFVSLSQIFFFASAWA